MECPKCRSEIKEGTIKCSNCEANIIAEKPLLQKEIGAYSGFLKRLIALIIDLTVYVVIIVPTVRIIIFPMVYGILHNSFGPSAIRYAPLTISFIMFWLYNSLLESSRFKGTIGKIIMKISVVSYEGKRITFFRASLRVLAKVFLSTLLFCYGYLEATYTKRKQALHDAIGKTLVINSGREKDLLLFKGINTEM